MTNVEDDIAAYLATGGFGTVGSTIFVNYSPPTPSNCLVVSVYAGSPPEPTHDTSGNDNPSVQVKVRNTNMNTARTTIQAVYNYLDKKTNITIGSQVYISIFAINSGAIPMGDDGNGRHEYSWNFSIKRRR